MIWIRFMEVVVTIGALLFFAYLVIQGVRNVLRAPQAPASKPPTTETTQPPPEHE